MSALHATASVLVPSRQHRVLVALALALATQGTAIAAEDWRLAGRHGECAALDSLKRKLPDLPTIDSPDALARHLDAKGLRYTRRQETSAAARMEQFEVPDAGLAILLVPARLCMQPAVAPR